MKNLKKLLVTMLALVLLICGATVVSLAADTPAEIMAEAQELLDAATKEGDFIAVRSQKMRELDRLIDSNMATIRNSQEWLSFRVSYWAHQDKLKEDCVTEARAALDKLLEKETSKADAEMLYAGLASLVSRSGDARGYFDFDSAEYAEIETRTKIAEAIAKLQSAEETVLYKDKGASLLWVYNQKESSLDADEAVNKTADYKLLNDWFKEIYAEIRDTLFAEILALTDKACLSTTGFEQAKAIAAEIEAYFTDCYFDTSVSDFSNVRYYANYAMLYAYLNQIERTKVLTLQGEYLKALAELKNNTYVSETLEPYGADFAERYNKLVDTADATSVVSRLRKMADGYKKDVADVFAPGYNGPLKSAADILAVVDELFNLVDTCYLGVSTYDKDVNAATLYANIYDFWVAMGEMTEDDGLYAERNALYKKAVSSYNLVSGSISSADPEYTAPLLAIYEEICAAAKTEIRGVLEKWLQIAELSGNKDEATGEYVNAFVSVRESFDFLNKGYLTTSTAYYYSAVENKTLTSRVKKAAEKAETRMLTELQELLAEIDVVAPLPETENLADMTAEELAFRQQRVALLGEYGVGLVFTYGENPILLTEFYSNYYVTAFLTKLCEIEAAYAAADDDAAFALYNELKTLAGSNIASVDVESEGYLLYLYYLNKIEVRIGDANVPGARPYLDALIAVVDADSFDKVYALMHLDEYIRQNKITRPDASDTTSPSALFYQEYDELANKVKVWRQAIVDEREKNVSLGEYQSSGSTIYDGDTRQPNAQLAGNKFNKQDGREYGAGGSQFYMTFDYVVGGGDGFIQATMPSSTENVIIEMDITTFSTWPKDGVSFNSGAYLLNDPSKRIYPWIGAISGDGQIIAPNGKSHGKGPVLTDREGGYIIPGQWTHFVIVYNAQEKMVSYYVNDEKIVKDGVDKWSCAQAGPFNFTEALRIGHSQSGAVGSFSIDNLQLYVGDQPRNLNLFNEMSAAKMFAYYTNYVKDYLNGVSGTASDAKMCYEDIASKINLYWGVKEEGGEEGYLFDETTYWSDGADPGITYAELKQAIDDYFWVAERADAVIEGELIDSAFDSVCDQMANILALKGIANLSKRQTALANFEAYVEANASYISRFNAEQQEAYALVLENKVAVEREIEAYSRADAYIQMVEKFAAARDLYSRTVHRNSAASMMAEMERDAALGYFDLNAIKTEVAEFTEAISLFNEQNALLESQIIKDNNKLIVDCMARFPATPEEAMKNYASLNKYIVMVRSILLEGKYNAKDVAVEAAIAVYNVMNETFYDALQRDHAATVQDLIDQFNAPTSAYINKLGIYRAVKAYLEENAATIDMTHDSIKGIYSQFEIMEQQFGTAEGRDEQWIEYQEILNANTLKFITLVTQMRFEAQYSEILRLRDEAATLFYFMDSSSPEAQLAVENYMACEVFLTQAAINGDAFIEIAYALKKATGMKETYRALLKAQAAFADIDVTYVSSLVFTEIANEKEYTVEFTMAQAVETYQIILSQYTSFVTVINADVDVVLDVVCTVRASFPVNRTMVALFKKFYD